MGSSAVINGKEYNRGMCDHTTTGIAPTNFQPKSGIFLCPLAFHDGDINKPGISSTICGSLGLQVNITVPSCTACVTPAGFHAKAVVVVDTVGPYLWKWRLKEIGTAEWFEIRSVEKRSGVVSEVDSEAVPTLKENRKYILEARTVDS